MATGSTTASFKQISIPLSSSKKSFDNISVRWPQLRSTTRRLYRLRRIKEAGPLFILLWNILVFSYQRTALNSLVISISRKFTTVDPWVIALIAAIITDCLPQLLYPFAGWIADAKLGRYKVMRYSLWIMWAGSILLTLTFILRYTLLIGEVYNISYTLPMLIVIYIINAVGISGFHVNVIPFGIDQMKDCSGEQMSAFVHWYFWTRNFNFGIIVQLVMQSTSYYCSEGSLKIEHQQRYDLIILLIQITFLTAAVCLDCIFSDKLSKDPKIHNPVKKVINISGFILKNNQLVGHRKAHTFTYDTPPTRSDFAKQSYGGPYEDDEVEDVTAFWRIIVFSLVAGFGVFVVYTGTYNYPNFFEHFHRTKFIGLSNCSSKSIITNFVSICTYAISIPIFEFFIYPFFSKYIPRMIVRIGLGMFVMLIGLSILLIADAIGHSTTQIDNCMFYNHKGESYNGLDITTQLLIPVIIIVTIGEMLVFISVLEFICAQSPYSMRGLIIGIFYFITSIFVGLLSITMLGFALGFKKHSGNSLLSCGTWYLMAVIVIGIIGTLLYIITAKWYKKRQRGGQTNINHQTIVENYYES